MPTRPNRKTVTDGMFLIQQGTRRHPGKVGGIDFTKLSDAENDILFDWDWYNSHLQSERHALDQEALNKAIEDMASEVPLVS